MKTIVIVDTTNSSIVEVQSVSSVKDIKLDGDNHIALYGTNSVADSLNLKGMADLYNALIPDGATPIKKFPSKTKGADRVWGIVREKALEFEAVTPGPAVKAEPKVRKSVKQCLRTTFAGDATEMTKEEIQKKVDTCMGRVCKWIDIAAHMSELKNPKYAGTLGVLVIERNPEGKYVRNM